MSEQRWDEAIRTGCKFMIVAGFAVLVVALALGLGFALTGFVALRDAGLLIAFAGSFMVATGLNALAAWRSLDG